MTLSVRATKLLAAAVLLICVAFAVRVLSWSARDVGGDFLAFSDFFAQWSFGWFARMNHPAAIYDAETLHEFQLTLEPALRQKFPFAYPPTYLLAVFPLSLARFGYAYLAWDAVTLALFVWAVLGKQPRFQAAWFALLAPVTIIALSQGQNGLLTSALLVGGMRLMRDRPILGGVLLGLATIKPQLGILVPLALIAAGYWRTVAAAGATAVALGLASGIAFGWDTWPAWWNAAVGHAAYVEHTISDYLKPGLMANLALFHVAAPVAHAAQAGVSLAVAAIVVWSFRRGAGDLSLAALQVGTFLAMPYAFRYDMPMTVNAILLLARDRQRPVGLIEAGILALGLLAPALNTVTTRFFYVSGISLLLLFGLIVWRQATETRGA